MIELVAGGASDVGRVRTANQDSWSIAEGIWAIADGMGGHLGGEVASKVAIETLGEHFDEPQATTLVDAAQQANAAVHRRASQDTNLRGMGTTLCAMALVESAELGEELAVINVGDSRCYQWRDGAMTQITRDHSLVEDMRIAGQITEEEAAVHPHRNIVTRALGIQPDVEVDEFVVIPQTGDRYILCSDGLFNELSNERISATLRRLADPQDAASELVRQANEAGGRDNVTCVVVDVLDDDGSAERAAQAGRSSIRRRRREPDVAGITTAVVDDANDTPTPTIKTKEKPAEPKQRLRRATWRSAIFVVLLLLILGAAALAVGWYSRGTYYVGFGANNEVTVFQGRPQPVLWFDPTVKKQTGIYKAQVPDAQRDALTQGHQVSSVADADAFVAQMRTIICTNLLNGARPPVPAPGAPTTTIPASCAKDVKPPVATTTLPPTTLPPETQPPATPAPTTLPPPTTIR